jgi:hypothetical protein
VGVLAVGATAGLDQPAPAASGPAPAAAGPAPAWSFALGRAAGSALARTPAPVPGGQVVVGLIDPTDAVGVAPGTPPAPMRAERLGRLVARSAVEAGHG